MRPIISCSIVGYYLIPKQNTTIITMNDALHLIKECRVARAYTIGDDGRGTTTHTAFKLKDGSVVHTEKNTLLFIFQDARDNAKCT